MTSRITLSFALLGAFIVGMLSFAPVAKAVEALAVVTCKQANNACTGGTNNSTGAGVSGTSSAGNGSVGRTKFNSTSAKNYTSGILGLDISTKGKWDAGVTGSSTRGTGVLGITTSLFGMEGVSQTGTGVWGQVNGGNKNPTGVQGLDTSSSTSGAGVAGQSKVGSGVVGITTASGNAGNASQAFLALAPNSGWVFIGVGPNNGVVAQIDNAGDLAVAGTIGYLGSCVGCSQASREKTYGTAAATPTLEDSGEAQLVGGAAYVRVDPNFARAIDPQQGYFVLITPEAETRGLYVAQRTFSGFSVRENAGGHSSGPFAYRIVGHPFGVHAPRLPHVQMRTVVPDRVTAPITAGE